MPPDRKEPKMTIPSSDYTEAQLLNANALQDDVAGMLRSLLEGNNRRSPNITNERLKQSLTLMDVAVVRSMSHGGASPIVAMGTLSRVTTLGRGCGIIREVVVADGHIHHRANLIASVVGRLLARAQEFAMAEIELHQPHINLAGEVLAAYGYRHDVLHRIGLLTELR